MNHGRFFREACGAEGFAGVAEVLRNPEEAGLLDAGDRAMLAFAGKMAENPGKLTEADIEALRAAGLSEENVVDAVAAVCYRIFANHLNFATGRVERDPEGPPELLAALRALRENAR